MDASGTQISSSVLESFKTGKKSRECSENANIVKHEPQARKDANLRELHRCQAVDSAMDAVVEHISELKLVKGNMDSPNYTTPKFVLKYQVDMDLEDFQLLESTKIYDTLPSKLIVVVNLPGLENANNAVLDVKEKSLHLISEQPAKYCLSLILPYCVDADNGNAKFDAENKKLTVTLPVIRNIISLNDMIEDSGVDSDNSNSNQEVSETAETKKHSSNNQDPMFGINNAFFDSETKYVLPSFSCNVLENFLAVTIKVKNARFDSFKHRVLDGNSGVQVMFQAPSSGTTCVFYALCLRFGKDVVDPDSIGMEPWDNNVVLTLALKNVQDLVEYEYGLNEGCLEKKHFSCINAVKDKMKSLMEPMVDTKEIIQVYKEENDMVISIHPQNLDANEEDSVKNSFPQHEKKRTLTKSRSLSESSSDELHNNCVVYKSILKSRSVSESSIDEGVAVTSCPNFSHDSGPEINSESECGSSKKTVRFNEVVVRKLYRSNSSIFGQRRKNQRKMRNKKRSNERRLSESENSETEEREKFKVDPVKI